MGELTSPGAAAGSIVVLVPLGSLEQHGPHLPLDTDTRIAVALCVGAARAWAQDPQPHRAQLRIGPTIGYGASGEHAGFAGTLSIGTEALSAMLVELTRSAGPEIEALVVVNGHGGNHEAVRRAAEVAHREGRRLLAWSPPLPPDGDHHAGWVETSVMLALHPTLVRLELAEAGNVAPIGELADALRRGGLAAVSPNGVLGDPAPANAARGGALLAGWERDLSVHLRRWLAMG
ncbi:MAG: mycofactocin biosynthesis peptidyl-dipeptidase MftE [Acidimicrobiales bacterium]